MNYRLILFSGITTAILGALFGWALSYIGRPDIDRTRYESEFYRDLYHRYPLIGAGAGFVTGCGFAVIGQKRQRSDRDGSDRYP